MIIIIIIAKDNNNNQTENRCEIGKDDSICICLS